MNVFIVLITSDRVNNNFANIWDKVTRNNCWERKRNKTRKEEKKTEKEKEPIKALLSSK